MPPIPYTLNPLGISVREELPLTFTALEASTVKLTATGSPTVSGLHYRLGSSGLWLPYTIGDTINLATGKKVQFWNSATALSRQGNFIQFVMTGTMRGGGTLQSLYNYSTICPSYGFWLMFDACTSLIQPPDLTAKTLDNACYGSTFRGSGIFSAPKIMAENFAYNSFLSTFRNCYYLSDFPLFRASILVSQCLRQTFINCTSLISAKLHATQLGSQCCEQLFDGCSSLSIIEIDIPSWGTGSEFANWVRGVAASGTFIKPAALPEEYGPNRIPTGWTVINK